MKFVVIFCFLILIIISVNCGETNVAIDNTKTMEISGNYNVTKFGKELRMQDGVTIGFSALDNNSFYGNTGCNSFFGNYSINLNEILFGQIAVSEMFCNEDLMNSERLLLDALEDTGTYSIKNNILTLYSKVDKTELLIGILDTSIEN